MWAKSTQQQTIERRIHIVISIGSSGSMSKEKSTQTHIYESIKEYGMVYILQRNDMGAK